ncbi:MAG TPA: DUF6541 family protein [Amnibacterium sp.]|jgi:hypothetical protein
MTWIGATLPVVATMLVVFVPGTALAAALKVRGATALALAGPLGFGTIGVAGVASAALHMRFGWWSVAVTAAVAGLVLLGVRLLVSRSGAPLPGWDTWRPSAVLPVVLGVGIASVAIGSIAFAAVPSPERVSQTYDAVFHLNAVQSIVQSGDASSLHLYRLTHPTQTTAFYPAVFHSIAAIAAETTGVPVPVAVNAAWIGTAGPVFAFACAFAARVLFGATTLRRGETAPPVQPVLIAAVAAVLASAFVAFPYLLLDFGTLYPNGLAYTTLPVGLGLVAAATRWPEHSPWRPEAPEPRWRTVLLLLGWLGAAGFTHPRSVVAIGVLVAPLLVAWFAARMRALALRSPQAARRARLIVVVVVAVVVLAAAGALLFVLHYYDVGHRPISDHLNGGPARAREGFGTAVLQGLLATSLVSPSQSPLPPAVLLAVVALTGLVALALRPGLRWAAVTYLAIVLLYAAAAGSDSDLAKLATGLWDKDKFRILAMLPTIAVPVVAWILAAGGAELVAVLRRRTHRRQDPRDRTVVAAVAVATLLVAAVTWFGPALTGVGTAIGTVFSLPDSDKQQRLLDADEVLLLQQVGRFVPAGQVIADDPWNGTALAWALGGRQTLFPHLGGYWGTERKLIAQHLDAAPHDPAVCKAVRDLDLHWLLVDPQRLWNNTAESKAFSGIDRAAEGTGVQLVASSGSTRLYRITACWS